MLALTGALAAACFVKAFGITFLAQPRSEPAAHAHEAAFPMRLGMGLLAVACVALGLFPTQFIRLLDPVTQQLTGRAIERSTQRGQRPGADLAGRQGRHGFHARPGLDGRVPAADSVRAVAGLWPQNQARRGPTWDCGQRGLTPQMEYTATGFSKPIRMVFKALFQPHREVQREYDFSPYFATNIRFDSHVEEVFERRIYRPLAADLAGGPAHSRPPGGQHPRLPALHFRHAAVAADVCHMNLNLPAILAQTALLLLLAPLLSGLSRTGRPSSKTGAARASGSLTSTWPNSCARTWSSPSTRPGCSRSRPTWCS